MSTNYNCQLQVSTPSVNQLQASTNCFDPIIKRFRVSDREATIRFAKFALFALPHLMPLVVTVALVCINPVASTSTSSPLSARQLSILQLDFPALGVSNHEDSQVAFNIDARCPKNYICCQSFPVGFLGHSNTDDIKRLNSRGGWIILWIFMETSWCTFSLILSFHIKIFRGEMKKGICRKYE